MDPALWELLRTEAGTDGDQMLEAIIRLSRPGIEIPDVRVISSFGTVATCRIRARDVVPVRALPDVVSLKAARGLSPGFEPAANPAAPDVFPRANPRPTDVRRSRELSPTGRGVVVASVDWGVDVDSAAFRWPAGPPARGGRPPGGTRFLSLWDQRDQAVGPRPEPYGYGTVHDREQIDGALQDRSPYERLGYHPAIADRGGHGAHGTHVLDIAAGNGQAGGPVGIAPGADLVFVHLADRRTGGLANLGDSVRLLEAIDFISRAAGSRPCVINISAGRTCGPKDGTTLVERALDELLAATPGRFVVNSAGNYFGRRTHACGVIAPGESRSLTFVIDPANITVSEVEVWYDGADEFAVRIDPPGHAGGRAVRLGERSDLLIEGRVAGRIYHRKHDPNNGDNHIVVYIDPVGRSGDWTVTLEALRVETGRFHAWIERDDTCPGCQARFTPADSSPVTTIGTITTSHLPLIVGAYDGHDPARPVAPFSSSGPSRDLRRKPDLAAPGVGVLAARSASIVDSRNPGLLVRKSGTSMATPHVTGAVALCLEVAGDALSARQIRSLVLGSCDPVPGTDPQRRLGRGYLNIPRLAADAQRAIPAPAIALGAKEPTMDTEDAIALLTAAPGITYREYLYRPRGQLARWIGDRYAVVAGPGQRVDRALRRGDVLIEVVLGQMRAGRCIILDGPELEVMGSRPRLLPGQLILRPLSRPQMSEPMSAEPNVHEAAGWYAGAAEAAIGTGIEETAEFDLGGQPDGIETEESESGDAWTRALEQGPAVPAQEAESVDPDLPAGKTGTAGSGGGESGADGYAPGLAESPAGGGVTAVDPFPRHPYLLSLDMANEPFSSCAGVVENNPVTKPMCGAIADVTGNPDLPAFYAHNPADMLYVGSLAKIYAMYVAFELRKRVEEQAKDMIRLGLSTAIADWESQVFTTLERAWKPRLRKAFPGLPEAMPKFSEIFVLSATGKASFAENDPPLTDADLDCRPGNPPLSPEFKNPPGKFRDWMRLMLRWSNNEAASKCIRALGYPYINGVLGAAGFFNESSRTGLWLSGDYQHHDWLKANRAGQPLSPRWARLQRREMTNFAGTAFQVARMLTLLAQERLVDKESSTAMLRLMTGAAGIGSYVVGGLAKAAPPRALTAIASKIGYGNEKPPFSHDCAIVRVDRGSDPARPIRYVVVTLGSHPHQARADLGTMAVHFHDCVATRNS